MYSVEFSTSDQMSEYKALEMKNELPMEASFSASNHVNKNKLYEHIAKGEHSIKDQYHNNINNNNNINCNRVNEDENVNLESNCSLLELESQEQKVNNNSANNGKSNNVTSDSVDGKRTSDEDHLGNDVSEDEVVSPRRYLNNSKLPIVNRIKNSNNNNHHIHKINGNSNTVDACNGSSIDDWDKVYSKRLSNAHRLSLGNKHNENDEDCDNDDQHHKAHDNNNNNNKNSARQFYKDRRNSICSIDEEHNKDSINNNDINKNYKENGSSRSSSCEKRQRQRRGILIQSPTSSTTTKWPTSHSHSDRNNNSNNKNNNNKSNKNTTIMVGSSWEVQVFDSYSADANNGISADRGTNKNCQQQQQHHSCDDVVNSINNEDNTNSDRVVKRNSRERIASFPQSMTNVSALPVSVEMINVECNALIKTTQAMRSQLSSRHLAQPELVKLHTLLTHCHSELKNCLTESK